MKFSYALLLGYAAAKNVASKDQFKVQGRLVKRGFMGDSVNRVDDMPGHDGDEPLFHIQDNMGAVDLNPPMPGSGGVKEHDVSDSSGPKKGEDTLLRNELAVTPEISIFAGYVREYESLESRFNDKKHFSVVMSPSDQAVMKLGKKPWEFPNKVDEGLTEREKEVAFRKNILNFLQNHMHFGEIEGVFAGFTTETERFTLKTEAGEEVYVEAGKESLTVTKDGVTASVTKTLPVENGVIWILDTSLVSP